MYTLLIIEIRLLLRETGRFNGFNSDEVEKGGNYSFLTGLATEAIMGLLKR